MKKYNINFSKIISEAIQNEKRKTILKENLTKSITKELLSESILSEANKKKEKKKNKKEIQTKRAAVLDRLRNDDTLNHAEIMRQLWHPKDGAEEDVLRSLFSKKVREKKSKDSNSRYKFNPEEINKIFQLINANS